MSIYEILPALDLTQSVLAKISIGMHPLFTFLWCIAKINAPKMCHNNRKKIHKLHKSKAKYNQMFMIIEINDEVLE
jgi:hypothetical protein